MDTDVITYPHPNFFILFTIDILVFVFSSVTAAPNHAFMASCSSNLSRLTSRLHFLFGYTPISRGQKPIVPCSSQFSHFLLLDVTTYRTDPLRTAPYSTKTSNIVQKRRVISCRDGSCPDSSPTRCFLRSELLPGETWVKV
jgi:hypothetical protein